MIGCFGFVIYLGSFGSVQLGWLDGNGMLYCALNVCAASLVLMSLSGAFNMASALIQVSWIAIGLYGLATRIIRKRRPIHVARSASPPSMPD